MVFEFPKIVNLQGTKNFTSHIVKPRHPFFTYNRLFDYSIDSEDEWEEEEEEGDECLSDEDNLEVQDDVSNDDEDRWLVPHGYLSEDEGIDATMANDSDNDEAKSGLELTFV